MKADPKKINAVADCPTPTFADALYVTKATPLPEFSSKVSFVWAQEAGSGCQERFSSLLKF